MFSFHPPLFLEELRDALHPLTPADCNALIDNKHIISKKIGKKIYYSRESLESLKKAFNFNDYYTFAEVADILNEENLSGYYDLFGFNINPTNLIEHKYITLDNFIQKYIFKKSLDNAIPVLLKTKANLEAANNEKKAQIKLEKIIEFKKEELLKPKLDEYTKARFFSKLNNTVLTIDEPSLSQEEVSQIEKEAHEEVSLFVNALNNTEFPLSSKRNRVLKKPKNGILKIKKR